MTGVSYTTPDKANVVVDALSRFFISSVAHVEEEKKYLVFELLDWPGQVQN